MSRATQYIFKQVRGMQHRLMQIRDTPHAIAGGVAIGLLFGFTPLFGFKTVIAVLVAWLFRCSKLSAALAVTFHDILLPIWPVVLRWQFQIGYFLLSHPHSLPPKFSAKHFDAEHFYHYFSWKTLKVLWPTLIGSVILAAPLSLISYFLMLEIVKRSQAKRARLSEENPDSDVTVNPGD